MVPKVVHYSTNLEEKESLILIQMWLTDLSTPSSDELHPRKLIPPSIWKAAQAVELILVAFEHSVLRVREIYTLDNTVFCIAV